MSSNISEVVAQRGQGKIALLSHPFFRRIREASPGDVNASDAAKPALTRADTAVFLGQWWHPLHYFPVFLSKTIAVLPRQETKTAVSKILYQELGEGDPLRAHERVYVDTMRAAGFAEDLVTGAPPFPETRQLIEGYAQAAEQPMSALGFLYGTEVADLTMVSGIGEAVRRTTGAVELPWVDIHVMQEPEHVVRANEAVTVPFAPDQLDEIVKSAEVMWKLWVGFFNRLHAELAHRPARGLQTAPSIAL